MIVLACSGRPPAVALLSSGDVHMSSGRVLVGIHGSSSAAARFDGSFTLLVPLGDIAVRLEVSAATVAESPPLVKFEGPIDSIRPTAEPPWLVEMKFVPERRDHPAIPRYIEYWQEVKAWLANERPEPPQIPFQ